MNKNDIDYYNKYIDQFESSGSNKYTAYNKGSKAYGKYQHLPSTTTKAARALGKSVSYLRTPTGQEEAQGWLLTENVAELKRRGIPVTGANVYGIHQQGGYVLSKMIGGKALTAREQKLVINNTPAKYRGSGDIVADWYSAYDRKGDSNYQPSQATVGEVSAPEETELTQFNLPEVNLNDTQLPETKFEPLKFEAPQQNWKMEDIGNDAGVITPDEFSTPYNVALSTGDINAK